MSADSTFDGGMRDVTHISNSRSNCVARAENCRVSRCSWSFEEGSWRDSSAEDIKIEDYCTMRLRVGGKSVSQ